MRREVLGHRKGVGTDLRSHLKLPIEAIKEKCLSEKDMLGKRKKETNTSENAKGGKESLCRGGLSGLKVVERWHGPSHGVGQGC